MNDTNKCINLHGNSGSGKSTIALNVAELLKEDWMLFYIRGVDPSLSPYLTWHIGTKLHSKNKFRAEGSFSCGVSFLPIPLTIELGGGSLKPDKINFILSSSEEALINNIKKQSGSNKNILFISDDYDLWDIPSKQLLQKIAMPSLKLLENYHVTMLIISQEKTFINSEITEYNIPILPMSDDNLLFILHQNGFTGALNLNDIRACSGNDLSLCLMAAQYYEKNVNGPVPDFNEIMNRRYNALTKYDQEACKVLEPLSIIDTCFSEAETAYFLDTLSDENTELLCQAEEYLFLAQKQEFIIGDKNYQFINQKIKDYFRTKLLRREKYHHRKFAEYLQRKHPEDYYNRAKHLKFSLQKNDEHFIYEVCQLLLIAYVRRASELGWEDDVYNIIPEIKILLERVNPYNLEMQQKMMLCFLDGYRAFSVYDYRKTIYCLQGISPMLLTPAFRAECQRMIVLSHVQLAENPKIISQTADELYDIINSPDFNEDEQYCRAGLVLLEVFVDRFNVPDKVKQLKQRLIKLINLHSHSPEFLEFNACYNRKSALYYTASIACNQTEESVRFYREYNNRNGLYMALCNHSANAIVSGKYTLASDSLEECFEMIQAQEDRYYPSLYKIKNNKILLTYLEEEAQASFNRELNVLAAKRALKSFEMILDYQEDEVSHVIYLNHLSLSVLCKTDNWQDKLAEANRLLSDTDAYYKYFLYNLNFAGFLINSDLSAAASELEKIKKIEVPLLYNYAPILKAKWHAQERFLAEIEQFKGDAFDYNQAILSACSHVQDSSCAFYGRGFLLSDLQFLSY